MEEKKNPFAIPGIKRVKIDSQLNPRYSFDNFIEGEYNYIAISVGQAIAQNPGDTIYNPLFVFGENGIGKTHFVQSIGNKVLEQSENKSVLYVSSEKFTNQIIQAIKVNSVNDFVNFYQMVDVLIMDDIQFLSGKQKTQEIFFHIFNQLTQNGKQIILTADRSPKDLDGVEDRLISRFVGGVSVFLKRPDFETIIKILNFKAVDFGISLTRDAIEYIAHNLAENVNELEGLLKSLKAEFNQKENAVDINVVKKHIFNNSRLNNRTIFIKIPEQIRTAIKQYLNYFNEYTNATKGVNFNIEVRNSYDGILIELPEIDQENIFEVYLKEYLSFIKMKVDEIKPNISTDLSQNRIDILTIDLKNQVRFLQSSLEIKEVENRVLSETIDTFKSILLQERNVSPTFIIQSSNKNENNMESNINQDFSYVVDNNKDELLEQVSLIKKAILQDEKRDMLLSNDVLILFKNLEDEIKSGKVKKTLIDKILTSTAQLSSIGSFVINLIKILNNVA